MTDIILSLLQKDEAMLRLYSYYSVGTTLAAAVPTVILLSRLQYLDVGAAFSAIGKYSSVI